MEEEEEEKTYFVSTNSSLPHSACLNFQIFWCMIATLSSQSIGMDGASFIYIKGGNKQKLISLDVSFNMDLYMQRDWLMW